MQLTVNGNEMELPDGLSVDGLLQRLEIDPRFRAVAVNREVIRRDEFSVRQLQEGDRIEIVRPVSGG